jgi:hypothetical protein
MYVAYVPRFEPWTCLSAESLLCVQEALFQYAREAADFATKGQLPHLGQTFYNSEQFFWFHLLEYLQLYEFPK